MYVVPSQTNVKSLYAHTYFVSQSAKTVKLLLQLCVTPSRKKAKHPAVINDPFYRNDFARSVASEGLLVPINALISQSRKQARDLVTGAPPTRTHMLTGFLSKEMMLCH